MSGFFSPAIAKTSITLSEVTALEMICRIACSSSSSLLCSSATPFARADRTA